MLLICTTRFAVVLRVAISDNDVVVVVVVSVHDSIGLFRIFPDTVFFSQAGPELLPTKKKIVW